MKASAWRLQNETSECGLACLCICLNLLGSETDMVELRRRYPVSSRGLTLKDLSSIAAGLDLSSRAIRCDIEAIRDLPVPTILHWGFNHFVVYAGIAGNRRNRIVDPALGEQELSLTEVSRKFTGVALEVVPAASFSKRRQRSGLGLTSIVSLSRSFVSGMAQAVVWSILLQIYVLASPFYLQLAIDEAAIKSDMGLMGLLAAGFAAFALFNAVFEYARGLVIQRVTTHLSWEMTVRMFHHMLRLPLPWFQRRRLADVLTRFESLDPIKQMMTDGLASTLLDAVLGVTLLVAMAFYSPSLTAIVLLGALLSGAIKAGSVKGSITRAGKALQASVAEKGKRIETLRAMQTIKLQCAEVDRGRDWANKMGTAVAANQHAAVYQTAVRALCRLIESLALVAIVYAGVAKVVDQGISVGMLYAFLAYRTQFTTRFNAVLDQAISWKLTGMHMDRISDIALEAREEEIDRVDVRAFETAGDIDLVDVEFGYSPYEPPILKGISLSIREGELVAIIGPSGTGKSTLLKIMTGLYPANRGEVRYGGISVRKLGPRSVRARLGVVMQDDELMSGTILENVAFFSEGPDIDRVWGCLRSASLDHDVRMMPMQLNTLIGDMGSSLSGGQRQRLLLARALYRQPKILLLDEATSNLDIACEQRIHATLKALKITRIVVTHRPDTMALADRVILLGRDGAHEVAPVGEEARKTAVPAY